MRKLTSVKVDKENKTAHIGAGILSIDLLQALEGTGLDVVIGGCPTVGIAGFTLGGGQSDMCSNVHGLSAGNVLEAKVILASG